LDVQKHCVGENPGGNPAFEKTADAIYTYDFSDNDGFNSKGIRHCGALCCGRKLPAILRSARRFEPLRWYRKGTGAVVGVALLPQRRRFQHDQHFSLVERGDGKNQITAYYRRYKDGAYGLATWAIRRTPFPAYSDRAEPYGDDHDGDG
jgi:hypothetical protein